jgi:Helix-turn-helix domain
MRAAQAAPSPQLGAPRPLEAASRRLRGRPGRPRTAGQALQGATLEAQPGAAGGVTLPPLCRGLSVKQTAEYLGVSPREVWRMVTRGLLKPVRWPGCRRVIFDSQDVGMLFDEAFKEPR